MRKLFNISSNGFLEIQWYLFAAVFLLAPASNYMHGAIIPVDGGWLGR